MNRHTYVFSNLWHTIGAGNQYKGFNWYKISSQLYLGMLVCVDEWVRLQILIVMLCWLWWAEHTWEVPRDKHGGQDGSFQLPPRVELLQAIHRLLPEQCHGVTNDAIMTIIYNFGLIWEEWN